MSDHFRGKSVVAHLQEARARGYSASHEVHGAEMPGHFGAATDAAKDTAIMLALLWTLSWLFPLPFARLPFLIFFSVGLCIWKTGRSALLGWMRMERLHRLIEEERWEIEHHRNQERAELAEMYRAKGFEGKLLEEVLDVLMADDNRLLKVMLEEELGLTLEAYEHPLKQSFGALLGVAITSLFCLFGLWLFPVFGFPVCAVIAITCAVSVAAKWEKNPILPFLLWNVSLALLVCGAVYFLMHMF